MTDHETYREWPAAYVLGGLDADERLAFEAHLADCPACATEVSDFAPIPGLLARIELSDEASAPDRIADLAVARIGDDWSALRRSRDRWRVMAVTALVAAIVVFGSTVLEPAPEPPAAVFVVEAGSQATGQISADARFWGTALDFELADLPTSDRYEAWVVGDDGEWQQVAVWGPTPASRARLEGSSSIQLDDVRRVVITAGGREHPIATASR